MFKPINNSRGAVMVWLVSYFFFLLTLVNNFSASHDSIHYLLGVVKGEHLYHQHHLLYNFSAHWWWVGLKKFFPFVADHYLIESFTAIWGSGSLAMCYLFFRNRFGLPPGISALSLTLIAFSYGTWFYSVNIEVYAPPVFFILCSLYIITRKEFKQPDVWKVAILQSLAILFHQVNLLFIPVVVYWLYVNRNSLNIFTAFFQYAIIGVVITGGIYFFTGWYVEGQDTISKFTGWIFGYTVGHNFWHPLSVKTPLSVLAGFSRSFIGGHFIFQHPVMEDMIRSSFSSHRLKDEMFLSQNISPAINWILTLLAILFATALVVMVLRFIDRYHLMIMHYRVIKPLLVCLGIYSLFFCFWMPEIPDFWILQMILVWLILLGMLPVLRFPMKAGLRTGIILLSFSLLSVNYFGSLRWLQKIDHDWYYVQTKKLDPSLSAYDIVLVEDDWILKDYVRYYSKARVIATDEPGFNRAEAQKLIQNTVSKGGKVYMNRAKPGTDITEWLLIQSY